MKEPPGRMEPSGRMGPPEYTNLIFQYAIISLMFFYQSCPGEIKANYNHDFKFPNNHI